LHISNFPKDLKLDNVKVGVHEYLEKNSLPDTITPVIECFLFFDLEEIEIMKAN
tara:strand:- start:422 stop:583 length:162 start_codon:yes stop_codon:yes gene_type:complete